MARVGHGTHDRIALRGVLLPWGRKVLSREARALATRAALGIWTQIDATIERPRRGRLGRLLGRIRCAWTLPQTCDRLGP